MFSPGSAEAQVMWVGYNFFNIFLSLFHLNFMKVYSLWVPFECTFSCIIWEYACAFNEIPTLLFWGSGEGLGVGLTVVQVQHQLHWSSIYIFIYRVDPFPERDKTLLTVVSPWKLFHSFSIYLSIYGKHQSRKTHGIITAVSTEICFLFLHENIYCQSASLRRF